ncbi:MAG: carbohydrate ABC transporter permease [Clostridia bacterium]|nr:carbohydrate ABC transporter permease [Clostridia bacterium]
MKKQKLINQIILCTFFSIFCGLIIFPFWLLVSASLSDSASLLETGYRIIPKPLDLSAYGYIMRNPQQILNAYGITFTFSVTSMVFGVLLMAMIAYPLSRSGLKGRNAINFYLYFTMLFSGGLVPTYIIISSVLHLNNTLWVYILPGLISPWYVFMMRTFFAGIPDAIMESARIDGASEYKILFGIVIPLSKPVLATVALFVFLAKWNDWNTALIYITDSKLYSLQYLLQKMVEDINILKENATVSAINDLSKLPTETVRMAMAVVAAGPALIVFPFFQKYFVKGLTVGSVKG